MKYLNYILSNGENLKLSPEEWKIYRCLHSEIYELKAELIFLNYPNGRIIKEKSKKYGLEDCEWYFEYSDNSKLKKVPIPSDCEYSISKIKGEYYLKCVNKLMPDGCIFKVMGDDITGIPSTLGDVDWICL